LNGVRVATNAFGPLEKYCVPEGGGRTSTANTFPPLRQGQVIAGGEIGVSMIAASADRVGVYYAPMQAWLELDFSGHLLGRWTLPLPVWDLAFTQDGSLFSNLNAPLRLRISTGCFARPFFGSDIVSGITTSDSCRPPAVRGTKVTWMRSDGRVFRSAGERTCGYAGSLGEWTKTL
jgi:hypothetical protein